MSQSERKRELARQRRRRDKNQKLRKKQEAQRAHMQAYVDRFLDWVGTHAPG